MRTGVTRDPTDSQRDDKTKRRKMAEDRVERGPRWEAGPRVGWGGVGRNDASTSGADTLLSSCFPCRMEVGQV